MQTIKDFLYQTGKSIGMDTFFQTIGPWGTLILAVALGIIALLFSIYLVKKCDDVEPTWLKVTFMLLILGVSAFIEYIYIDGTISIINKLGGLLWKK